MKAIARKPHRRRFTLAIFSLIALGAANTVFADDDSPSTVSLHKQPAAVAQFAEEEPAFTLASTAVMTPPEETPPGAVSLNSEVTNASFENLAARLTALEQKEAKKDIKAEAEKKVDTNWIDLSVEKWTVKLGGQLQGDYINWVNADPAIPGTFDYFEFRRARLIGDGTGFGIFDFRLQIDVEPEAEGDDGVTTPVVELKDAYITMLETPWGGRIRWGNFFVPYGLEQVTNDALGVFLERSIPANGVFTADREVGMAFYNFSEDKNASFTTGVFFDNVSEALKENVNDNQGVRASGRVTWLPYYDEPSNGRYMIHTGAGVLYTDDQDDLLRFRTRPDIHEGPRLIDSGVLNAGSDITANLEAAVVWGPLSVQSELYIMNVDLDVGSSANLSGGYLYATYFLTGENRVYERTGQHGPQFGRVVPFNNFFAVPGCCGTGGWELKARVSYLDMSDINRGTYHDFTGGVNWYWNERIRLMFDWIHPITNAETTFGATTSDIIATRMDFNF